MVHRSGLKNALLEMATGESDSIGAAKIVYECSPVEIDVEAGLLRFADGEVTIVDLIIGTVKYLYSRRTHD